jgi:hypothetical protein
MNIEEINVVIQDNETISVSEGTPTDISEIMHNEEIRQENEAQRIENETSRENYINDLKQRVEDGEFDGQDGYSPIATVTKSDKVATITITDKNGTTTATVSDGQDSSEWGKITGTLSNQTDLNNALNSKQNTIDSTHKLDADLVDDSTSTNKFLTNSVQEISGRKTFDEYASFSNGLWSNSITNIAGQFSIQADDDSNVLTYDGFGTGKPTWQKTVQFYEGATTITPTNDTDVANKKYVDDNIPDLTDYVTNTDYATNSAGGVIRTGTGYATAVASNGQMYSTTKTYSDYDAGSSGMFISKGTLENVLNAKIGDINTAIDAINGEVI